MKLALMASAVFFTIGLVLIGFSRHVPAPLPSRPPTGNHGQGHSPQGDCPEQYREPVELDGQEFPLTCWGVKKIASFVGKGQKDTQKQAFTVDKVVTLELTADGKWSADMVTVPAMPGHDPFVCFRINGTPVLQCIYISDDGGAVQESVRADPERV